MNTVNRLGRIFLVIGIAALIAGVAAAFLIGGLTSQILLFSSILLNTLGITMVRSGKGR